MSNYIDQGALAEKAFAEYEFGDGVMVTDTSGWEYTTPGHMRTRKVYVETEREDDGPAPRWVLNFTVRFDPVSGALSEAYAMDEKGQIWGNMASQREVSNYIESSSMTNDLGSSAHRYALASHDPDGVVRWSVGGAWCASLLDHSPTLMTGPEVDAFKVRHPNARIVDVIVYREACEVYSAGCNSVLDHSERSTPQTRQAAREAGIKALIRAGFPEDALNIVGPEHTEQAPAAMKLSNYTAGQNHEPLEHEMAEYVELEVTLRSKTTFGTDKETIRVWDGQSAKDVAERTAQGYGAEVVEIRNPDGSIYEEALKVEDSHSPGM